MIDHLSEFMRQIFLDSVARNHLHGLVKSSFAQITRQQQATVSPLPASPSAAELCSHTCAPAQIVVTNQAATKNVNRDGTPAAFGSEQSEGLLVSPLADTLGLQAWRVALYFDTAGER